MMYMCVYIYIYIYNIRLLTTGAAPRRLDAERVLGAAPVPVDLI